MPGFKEVVNRYLVAVAELSYTFIGLVAEALRLPPDGFSRFFPTRENTMHRAKARPRLSVCTINRLICSSRLSSTRTGTRLSQIKASGRTLTVAF